MAALRTSSSEFFQTPPLKTILIFTLKAYGKA